MKIAMILDEEFPPDPRVENEAISLIDAGHDVFLFCITFSNKPTQEIINHIQVYRYKVPRLIKSISALAYTFSFYRWYMTLLLKNFFLKENFEAIHVHDMRIAKSVMHSLARHKKNEIIKVIDLHENRPEIMKYYEHVRKFPGNLLINPQRWKKWEENIIKMYDKIIVVTNESKQLLKDSYNIVDNKIIVFPNTVHPNFYCKFEIEKSILERFKEKFIIFYVGDTGRRRGLETAIKALRILRESIPNIMLVIAGKSKYDKDLYELVDRLSLNSFVSFEGFQDMQRIPSYILASKVCISPLHRNIHHDTTYANKIFQYMSFGVPVLVSDCTAQKNIVEKARAGLIHKAENTIDFAEKVMDLYQNSYKAKQLGENGKQFIKTVFNQKVTSKSLVNFYNN